jgi:hypothetical protein
MEENIRVVFENEDSDNLTDKRDPETWNENDLYVNLEKALKKSRNTQMVKIIQYFHFSKLEEEYRATLETECDIVRFNNFIKWDKKIKAYELLVPTSKDKYKLNPVVLERIKNLLPIIYAK